MTVERDAPDQRDGVTAKPTINRHKPSVLANAEKGRPDGKGRPLTDEEEQTVVLIHAMVGQLAETARRSGFSTTAVRRVVRDRAEDIAQVRRDYHGVLQGQMALNALDLQMAIGDHLSTSKRDGERPNARWLLDMMHSAHYNLTTGRLMSDQPTEIVARTTPEALRESIAERIKSMADRDPQMADAVAKHLNNGVRADATRAE
tara:strand:+ start:298 stop:906 length:609 start_codon:yes stop_codon:yes gene_type:complete